MSPIIIQSCLRHNLLRASAHKAPRIFLQPCRSVSSISSLSTNPHIKVVSESPVPGSYLLTYLQTLPPTWEVSIGTTTELPPTPKSFKENPHFLAILNDVLVEYAHLDEGLQSQAKAFAGPGGSNAGGIFSSQRKSRRSKQSDSGGEGTGGVSGANRGGYVHLSDMRNPPDFGRIAWPEDILGSVEVDNEGNIIGNLQPSGTYRPVTKEGVLGLSDFLREKLVAKLKDEERKTRI